MDKKWAPGLLMRKKIGIMANGWKLRRTDGEWECWQRIDRKWWKVHQFEAEIRVYLSNKQAAVKEKWYLYIICWVVKNLKEEGWGECSLVRCMIIRFFSFAITDDRMTLIIFLSAHQDNLKSSIQTFTGISTRIAGFVLFIFKKYCLNECSQHVSCISNSGIHEIVGTLTNIFFF